MSVSIYWNKCIHGCIVIQGCLASYTTICGCRNITDVIFFFELNAALRASTMGASPLTQELCAWTHFCSAVFHHSCLRSAIHRSSRHVDTTEFQSSKIFHEDLTWWTSVQQRIAFQSLKDKPEGLCPKCLFAVLNPYENSITTWVLPSKSCTLRENVQKTICFVNKCKGFEICFLQDKI